MKSIIIFLSLTCLCFSATEDPEFELIYKRFTVIVKSLPKLEAETPPKDIEGIAMLRRYVNVDLDDDVACGFILFWKYGRGDDSLRRWWSSKNSMTRTAIAVLVLSQPLKQEALSEQYETWKGYAQKFKKEEAQQRLKELAIAQKITARLSKEPKLMNMLLGKKEDRKTYSK